MRFDIKNLIEKENMHSYSDLQAAIESSVHSLVESNWFVDSGKVECL